MSIEELLTLTINIHGQIISSSLEEPEQKQNGQLNKYSYLVVTRSISNQTKDLPLKFLIE